MNNVILGSLEDHLGVCEEVVWAAASYLTNMGLRTTFGSRSICLCGF